MDNFQNMTVVCGDAVNTTWRMRPEQPANTTGNLALYQSVYQVLYGYGLPTICVCGFLGNMMNLIILAGKRVQRSLRKKERSANVGLIALAVADMSFCVTAFPSTFLPQDMTFSHKGFLAYYGCYCHATINIFIMTSTWLTVTMSTERYLAICHPLKSRNIITLQRTKCAIVAVYLLSAIFNIPVFWRAAISEVRPCNNHTELHTQYVIEQQILFGDSHFDHSYRAIWAVVGNFIPLALLLVFNVALMREIHKSYAMRKRMNGQVGSLSVHQHHANSDVEASNRITMTLVAIVVLFFILVAPSEILKHVAFLFGSDLSTNYTYMTIEIITNVMQTMNFSANFILYCIINPSFRRTMREMFCFHCYQRHLLDGEGACCSDAGAYGQGSFYHERGSSVRLTSLRVSSRTASHLSHSPKSPTTSAGLPTSLHGVTVRTPMLSPQ